MNSLARPDGFVRHLNKPKIKTPRITCRVFMPRLLHGIRVLAPKKTTGSAVESKLRSRIRVALLNGIRGKIVVIQVPWEFFNRRGISTYTRAVSRFAPTRIAVSRTPGGIWLTATKHVCRWDRLLREFTIADLPWQTLNAIGKEAKASLFLYPPFPAPAIATSKSERNPTMVPSSRHSKNAG